MANSITADNKELIRQFYKEVLGDWNMAFADKIISAEFISHDWPKDGPTGPQAFRDFYSTIRSAVPDARYEIDDLIAENDKVVVRWRMLGTHKDSYGDIPPTGKPVTLKGIAIYRVHENELTDRWVMTNLHSLIEEVKGSKPNDMRAEQNEH